MKTLRDAFFLLIGLIVIVGSFYIVLQRPASAKYQPTIEIGGKTIQIEVADTETKREQGLSSRAKLDSGHGMLFVFNTVGLYGFWMKDMNFPIDIVWLDGAKHMVDIERNVSPDTFPHVFYPPRPVKYVLETNPGEL